jgi:hypothetical protein
MIAACRGGRRERTLAAHRSYREAIQPEQREGVAGISACGHGDEAFTRSPFRELRRRNAAEIHLHMRVCRDAGTGRGGEESE